MRTRGPFLPVFTTAVLLGLAPGCSPAPTQDALGWNGRGMPLPGDLGAGGSSAGGAGGDPAAGTAGAGTAGVGAAGAAGAGTAGAEPGTAGAGPGTAGAPGGAGAGAAGDTSRAGAGGGAAGAGGPGTAGTGSAGKSGSAGAAPPVDAGVPPSGTPLGATCHLDVSMTTHSGGGNHQPKNVDAIWIQDASGKFVKSLYVMGSKEIQHLGAWNTATSAAGLSRNRVDAVTGATLSGYGTRTASWNCTDVNKKLVTTGSYQVCFDLNDGNGSDKHTCDGISLADKAVTVTPPDALPCFTARSLTYKR